MNSAAIIVEDEPLARKTLRDLLADAEWIDVVGEAADGLSAVELINRLKPALVFLDINLPELSGLEVLKRLTHEPVIIFTTAHDKHAVTAFELSATDYLLKPFGRVRLQQALERARSAIDTGNRAESISAARKALASGVDVPLERLLVRDGARIIPIEARQIERIDADGDYARVRAGGKTFLVSLSLSDFESKLDPERFLRVHRSHLVNLDFVATMESAENSQLRLKMKDGSTLVASRAASKQLRDLAI